MGQILLAGEESHERPPLLRDLITDGPTQRRIAGLQRVEDRALRDWARDVELHFATGARQNAPGMALQEYPANKKRVPCCMRIAWNKR